MYKWYMVAHIVRWLIAYGVNTYTYTYTYYAHALHMHIHMHMQALLASPGLLDAAAPPTKHDASVSSLRRNHSCSPIAYACSLQRLRLRPAALTATACITYGCSLHLLRLQVSLDQSAPRHLRSVRPCDPHPRLCVHACMHADVQVLPFDFDPELYTCMHVCMYACMYTCI